MAKGLVRESQTIRAMVYMYCQGQRHIGVAGRCCNSCADLLNYAYERLSRCVFGENKPVCVKCPIHCYRPQRRVQITAVMRYSGPRMLLRHPLLVRRSVNSYRLSFPRKRESSLDPRLRHSGTAGLNSGTNLANAVLAVRHLVNERKVPNKDVQKYLDRKKRTRERTLQSGSAGKV